MEKEINILIKKIKKGVKLDYKELENVFSGYLSGEVNDQLMTKVLKEICRCELCEENIFDLTDIFIKSGDTFSVNEDFIDKHSTGGVGDKTTLIVLPILASLGVKISKMSGRGLGYTGGTIDKLESVGVKTDLTEEEFYDNIEKTGMVISSQTSTLCPMDKKVYALRDVTGTTQSISLIAVSIMSKKIASGAKKILIDIKVGNGALVPNEYYARKLADIMIKIGKKYDREVVCFLTDMNEPLGSNIGNKIEVLEVIDILSGLKKNNLYELCVRMASQMLSMAKGYEESKSLELDHEAISSHKALDKFKEYVERNNGDLNIMLPDCIELKAKKDGYIKSINSRDIGINSMLLGAGRKEKTDKIDFDAGIILEKEKGSVVKKGDVLARLYGKNTININSLYKSFKIGKASPVNHDILIDIVK